MLSGAERAGTGRGSRAIALAGLVTLATALGIGRFAFTPLLPLMLHDRTIDLPRAGGLASVNYLGYLVGALACTVRPRLWARLGRRPIEPTAWVRSGLVATTLLTIAMAFDLPALWPWLRFAAGIVSAIVFIECSGWCLGTLARRGDPSLGSVIYAGPGAGIVVTGLCATGMVHAGMSASTGWAIFGGLALVLAGSVWRVMRPDPAATLPTAAATAPPAAPAAAPTNAGGCEVAVLAAAYGLAGFGYIVTATFLPVIARTTLPGSPWLDLFWPILGGGVVAGALLASRFRPALDLRLLLAGCYLVQAAGIGVGLRWASLGGFALGSLLVGLPFTVLTYYAMQEVRRVRPVDPSATMGLLTAVYGVGQIVGPLLASDLLRRAATAEQGFAVALKAAMAALVVGAALYLAMHRRWPVAGPRRATAKVATGTAGSG